jgi:lysozyme
MKTSQAGVQLIKGFEGVRLNAYDDGVGVMTIGVGHIRGVQDGDIITEDQADDYLREDLSTAEGAVNRLVKVPINQAQFDALVSFTFNLGAGALASSTLLKKLNAGDYDGAADELLRWNRAGGRIMAGLTKRRISERMLFLTGKA